MEGEKTSGVRVEVVVEGVQAVAKEEEKNATNKKRKESVDSAADGVLLVPFTLPFIPSGCVSRRDLSIHAERTRKQVLEGA